MPGSRWRRLAALGQSVWYDNVARPALRSGLLRALIAEDHVTGGTSNPSIFAAAVSGTDLYDEDIAAADPRLSVEKLFEQLAVADIREACDLLSDAWERTDGQDGYISIEEEPGLAFDTAASVARGHALRALVDRPNVMVKVPATEPGVEAFRQLTRDGLNVNMTLLFSRARYQQIVDAYIGALEERHAAGEELARITSVASFFVSRIDASVDAQLPPDSPLRGRAALANAQLAYAEVFVPAFTGERWRTLADAGAKLQRPLWASTGVKDTAYPATLYIDELIGAGTVTTVPDQTLTAFRDRGRVTPSLHTDPAAARLLLTELAEAGVDLDAVTAELERDGVRTFADAYDGMLEAIHEHRRRHRS